MNDEFDRLAPCNILTAIIDVREGYASARQHPGADHYEWDTRIHRPKMIAAVRKRFCQLCNCSAAKFPYHDDYIAFLWIRYRKLTREKKAALAARLGMELPIEVA